MKSIVTVQNRRRLTLSLRSLRRLGWARLTLGWYSTVDLALGGAISKHLRLEEARACDGKLMGSLAARGFVRLFFNGAGGQLKARP